MREFYRARAGDPTHDYVTADDAREALVALNVAVGTNLNFLGALFKTPGWEAFGFTKSKTRGRHSNRVFRWRYVG